MNHNKDVNGAYADGAVGRKHVEARALKAKAPCVLHSKTNSEQSCRPDVNQQKHTGASNSLTAQDPLAPPPPPRHRARSGRLRIHKKP